MHYKIFNAVSDVVEQLKAIQLQTEEMYASCEEIEIILLSGCGDEPEEAPPEG